jgi:hypothetical protein
MWDFYAIVTRDSTLVKLAPLVSQTTSNFVKQAMCPIFGFRSPHRENQNSAPEELPPLHQ